MTTNNNDVRINGRNWKRLLTAMSIPLGVVLLGTAIGVANSAGPANQEARRTRDAQLVVRTNQWLQERNFNPNSSADMKEALKLLCRELEARGDSC